MKQIKITMVVNVPQNETPVDAEDAMEQALDDYCYDWEIEELYAEEVET